jgi:hypothetical protein
MIKYFSFIVCVIFACIVSGARYEVNMKFVPNSARARLVLRNPVDIGDRTNSIRSLDCGPLTPRPDWGARGYAEDDPELKDNTIDGSTIISSEELLDPGDCGLLVFSSSGTATCTVNIVNWPGIQPQSFTGVVTQSGPVWFVTNLPCAKDIGLKILKAKQNRSGSKWLWVKIIAEFQEPILLNDVTNTFHSSLQLDPWLMFHYGDNIKINKKRTKARFGAAANAKIKSTKKNTIKIYAHAHENYQNEPLPVFINFNEYSGRETIQLDDKSKYKAPKE